MKAYIAALHEELERRASFALYDGDCPICGLPYDDRVEHLVRWHGWARPGENAARLATRSHTESDAA